LSQNANRRYQKSLIPGFSVPESYHSVSKTWGAEKEGRVTSWPESKEHGETISYLQPAEINQGEDLRGGGPAKLRSVSRSKRGSMGSKTYIQKRQLQKGYTGPERENLRQKIVVSLEGGERKDNDKDPQGRKKDNSSKHP